MKTLACSQKKRWLWKDSQRCNVACIEDVGSQGMQSAPRNWKKAKNKNKKFLLKTSKIECSLGDTWNLAQSRLTSWHLDQDHPQEKCKKAKWLSEEALQIAEKRREVKSKGEKERHSHLNAEFQRIARRDKKAFLSDQWKEIEEYNRMGETRDLFKKIRDTKGTFHAKMGLIKDRNGTDLTEAEDIKKRWQEYTEELYKKDLHDPDNHDGVITHLEPDILECEVKWALVSITMNKASGCDGIPAELFQILKDDAVKVLHSICQQIWRTQQWPQDWKRSVFIPIPKKGNAKECSNYCTIVLISHASKVMLKILQQGFSNTWTVNFQMFKLDLEKAGEPKKKLPTSAESSEKQESSRKTSISALLTMPKPLTVWITTNFGKFWKRWEYQITWPASWETCMQVRKQVRTGHGKTDWFQVGKGVHQGCILSSWLSNLHAVYIMRMLGWMKHKLESRFPGEISIISDIQMTSTLWQKVKKN